MKKLLMVFLFLLPIKLSAEQNYDTATIEQFEFSVVNRIANYHIVFGKNKYNKSLPITMTLLEFLFGSPTAFFYSSFRVGYPLRSFPLEDQLKNSSVQLRNHLTTGLAIGGGYGFSSGNHALKLILNINFDVGLWHKDFALKDHKQKNTWGSELSIRYYYYFAKKTALILGLDTGVNIDTRKAEDSRYTLHGVSIFYGASAGINF
ncbi:MAG: hypothetical protein ACRCWI_01155 [Brevinema sp.]